MDPKLTLKLFTKNAYFATKTPRKHLDHPKKKKLKKFFFLKLAQFVEKIDLEIFLEKKNFFWDLVIFSESTWVKKK